MVEFHTLPLRENQLKLEEWDSPKDLRHEQNNITKIEHDHEQEENEIKFIPKGDISTVLSKKSIINPYVNQDSPYNKFLRKKFGDLDI